ncbi:3963_t:CDS:2, partial [Dentiscutata erythropus]
QCQDHLSQNNISQLLTESTSSNDDVSQLQTESTSSGDDISQVPNDFNDFNELSESTRSPASESYDLGNLMVNNPWRTSQTYMTQEYSNNTRLIKDIMFEGLQLLQQVNLLDAQSPASSVRPWADSQHLTSSLMDINTQENISMAEGEKVGLY